MHTTIHKLIPLCTPRAGDASRVFSWSGRLCTTHYMMHTSFYLEFIQTIMSQQSSDSKPVGDASQDGRAARIVAGCVKNQQRVTRPQQTNAREVYTMVYLRVYHEGVHHGVPRQSYPIAQCCNCAIEVHVARRTNIGP